MVDAEASVDENDDGGTIAAVTTENSTEVTVDDDRFEVADGNLKLKDGSSLDFESDTSPIEVTLTAVSDGDDATATVSITVNDVNEAPMISVADGTTPDGMDASSTVDENVAGALLGEITLSDEDAGQSHTLSTSDARFVTKQDPEGGWWLALADGVSLDHEEGATVTVTVTVTDDGSPAMSASTDVTITVNDVNESPVVTGTVPNVTALAGKTVDESVDLTNLFDDPDMTDATVLRWELSGNPSWLSLHVEYGTDDNGNDTITGYLRGTPPTTGAESFGASMVTITARDSGGEAGSVDFYVVVDDANDQVTGVNLLDDNGNSIVEVNVDENDASGVVFGEITVDDIDHAMHPNGMHLVEVVRDPRFEIKIDDQGGYWLALKEGVSLDHEGRESGVITVTVRATDMNGEQNSAIAQARGAPKYKGFTDTATFTIVVNDLNDAPKAGTIGNWWVTVNDELEADEVNAGALLSVSLETDDGNPATTEFPAFTDQDAGDRLTYSISGASWVQIDERTGKITNVEDVLPGRGVHRVTVTATDSDGESASASFNINVAHSDAVSTTDTRLRGENEDPKANNARGSYNENSGEQRVATFTVSDADQDIPDHEFAIKSVQIISVVNADDAADPRNATGLFDHDSNPNTPNQAAVADGNEGLAGAFRLSDPVKSGNTWTYHIYARDTNPSPAVNTLAQLNPDATGAAGTATAPVEDVTITVQVTDGTGASDTAEIDIDINNVNEAPTINGATRLNPTGTLLSAGTPGSPGNLRVNQSENNNTPADATDDPKIVLYINLEDLWEDDATDDDDLIFGASSSASWIKILHGPGEWQDVRETPSGNLTWGTPGTPDVGRQVGTAPSGDADDLWVVIVEIDRTDRNTQGDKGSFTLTARDEGGATGTVTVPVTVTDENEAIGANAVTISGSPREDGTLRANFNENRDPDLAGDESAAIVLYTWHMGSVDSSGAFTSSGVIQRGTSNELTPTQTHVGNHIQVAVTYYEVFNGQITSNAAGTVQANTERAVSNTPDDGVGAFTITAAANTLTASALVQDGDYGVPGIVAATGITYSWQVSANGVGGWRDAPSDGDADSNPATYVVDDGDAQYYRAVATYNANNDDDGDAATTEEMESVYSHAVRVADLADLAAGSTPTPGSGDTVTPAALTPSGSPFPGGTLSVSGRGVSSVQWQSEVGPSGSGVWVNIPGATGALSVTSALAGSNVRALVTYDSTDPNNPGVTAIVASATASIGGQATGTAPPTAIKDYTIEGSVMGTGHARTDTQNAAAGVLSGHTVTITDTVPLRSLFEDPDTARLAFSAASTTGSLSGGTSANGSYVAQVDSGVLVLNLRSGELTYVSDQLREHDGDGADGAGNMLNLDITASDRDPAGTVRNSVANNFGDVVIRINVAPESIAFTAGTAAADSTVINADFDGVSTILQAPGSSATLPEVELIEEVPSGGREVLAVINVWDENWSGNTARPGHAFGVHEVTVTGDDRFMITHTGNGALGDSDGDGSTWDLRLKPGAKFDFETESDADNNPANGKQIVLTFTATDGGGLSTPVSTGPTVAGGNGYPLFRVVVTVMNDPDDDRARPGATETPGLKDDETGDTDDTTDGGTNGDADSDTDGGDPTPPPPGMSLGQIEDFVENMDYGEQDLLEDYLLTIDDGLDIV